jgi:hypothetical protein
MSEKGRMKVRGGRGGRGRRGRREGVGCGVQALL